jgi:predicted nucleic acid-binding Zn ribbon protein
MVDPVKRPFRYKCSSCGHGTTLMLQTETPTVETWCTCCSKNMEDNKVLVRFKEVW